MIIIPFKYTETYYKNAESVVRGKERELKLDIGTNTLVQS